MHNFLSATGRQLSITTLVGAILLTSFTMQAQPIIEESDPVLTDISKNSALHYWKAIATQKTPRTPQDVASQAFILQRLPGLPPSAFSVRKDAAIWLIDESSTINSLREALNEPICVFPIKVQGLPTLNLTHLAPLRELTQYCIQISKSYEYAENHNGAASVYVLLLDLIFKLNQDGNLTSTQAAWAILQDVVQGLEGYATRQPPTEALEILIAHIDEHPDLPFNMGENIRQEADRFASWLEEDPTQILARLTHIYGRTSNKPGILKLASLTEEEQVVKMESWTDGYRSHMENIAKWTDTPYLTGLQNIEGLDDLLEAEIEKDAGEVGNPLISLLVPYTRSIYERSLLARGQYSMLQVMLNACRYESLVGKWPKNLETLEAFSSREFPKDPFSGQDLFYRVRNKAPYLSLRAPKWMTQKDLLTHRLQLAIRKTADDKRFQRLQSEAIHNLIEKRKNEPLKAPKL